MFDFSQVGFSTHLLCEATASNKRHLRLVIEQRLASVFKLLEVLVSTQRCRFKEVAGLPPLQCDISTERWRSALKIFTQEETLYSRRGRVFDGKRKTPPQC